VTPRLESAPAATAPAAPAILPSLGGPPFLGAAHRLWRRGFQAVAAEALARHGSPVGLRALGRDYVLVDDPDQIQQVLSQPELYVRTRYYETMRAAFGSGLITSEGEGWRRRRQRLSPSFAHSHVVTLGPAMERRIEAELDRWAARTADGVLDLWPRLLDLTLRVVVDAMAGPLELDAQQVSRCFDEVHRHLERCFLCPPLEALPWPSYRRALATLERTVARIVAAARARPPTGLLRGLLEDDAVSPRELRDEAFGLLSAGHETLACALAWSLLLLAEHPEAQERLAAREPGLARRVLQEALRLHPPITSVSRTNLAEDRLGGVRLAPHSYVNLMIARVHRRPDLWEEPERFRPERFDPEQARQRHPHAYLPFGAGPHACIGSGFALQEGELALEAIGRRFRLERATDAPVRTQVLMTARPLGGLHLRLVPRANGS
jgi:cytochrome P450